MPLHFSRLGTAIGCILFIFLYHFVFVAFFFTPHNCKTQGHPPVKGFHTYCINPTPFPPFVSMAQPFSQCFWVAQWCDTLHTPNEHRIKKGRFEWLPNWSHIFLFAPFFCGDSLIVCHVCVPNTLSGLTLCLFDSFWVVYKVTPIFYILTNLSHLVSDYNTHFYQSK